MSNLFVGNFDFERGIASRFESQPPSSVRRITAELAPVWLAIAGPDDVLWCPEPIEPEFFERICANGFPRIRHVSNVSQVPAGLELVPWGWTEQVVRWGRSVGARMDHPSMDAVKTANSRRFSHRFEQARGVGLPGAAEVASVSQLSESIERLPNPAGGFVVKAEFGNSSRERFRHRGESRSDTGSSLGFPSDSCFGSSPIPGGKMTAPCPRGSTEHHDQLIRWALRRLAMGQLLFVEPWVERVDEAGVQLTIPRSGAPAVVGVTQLIVDAQGHYRGSQFAPLLDDDPAWRDAVTIGMELARSAQKAGYFGPLGIDAMRYRDESGTLRLRPIQDVNARWTMGRLSLGFRPLIADGETGIWRHEPASASSSEDPLQQHRTREIVTSPESVGGVPVRLRSRIQLTNLP